MNIKLILAGLCFIPATVFSMQGPNAALTPEQQQIAQENQALAAYTTKENFQDKLEQELNALLNTDVQKAKNAGVAIAVAFTVASTPNTDYDQIVVPTHPTLRPLTRLTQRHQRLQHQQPRFG